MKIAFILYSSGVISGRSNGVRSQAIVWANILRKSGHDCILINNWEHYNWKEFDVIHIFGFDVFIYDFVKNLHKRNSNIFLSPIIDSLTSYGLYKLSTFNGCEKLRLFSANYSLRLSLVYLKGICVRSQHEANYFSKSFSFELKKIFKIPLSFGLNSPNNLSDIIKNKESFCFHLSSIYQERKNVSNLIKAAKQFNFNLVLAGNPGNDIQFAPLRDLIGNSSNISVLGFVSQEEVIDLYKRAKVFALPSLIEGVGIVALDAAIYGCNLALTNINGPKEYYPNYDTISLINPKNFLDIGEKISKLLNVPNDLNLSHYILKNNSTSIVYNGLFNMYND